jgi:hypothetical protein
LYSLRFLAFDFIMPNHQLVECYIVFQPMELAKSRSEPTAKVCPSLSCHGIFEKWRPRDIPSLQGEEKQEYDQDREESSR